MEKDKETQRIYKDKEMLTFLRESIAQEQRGEVVNYDSIEDFTKELSKNE